MNKLLKEIMTAVTAAKKKFEKLIKNKKQPLKKRWEVFLQAPDFLKNSEPWVQHFDAFEDLEEGEFKLNEFERDVLFESQNRGSRIEMEWWDEWLSGIALAAEGKESGYAPWENSEGKKFTMVHYDAWREEVLAKNLGSFTFDW